MNLVKMDGICNVFKKAPQRGNVNIINDLNDTGHYYMKAVMKPLSQAAQKAKKDINICQKGEDLLLINAGGGKTIPMRFSELSEEMTRGKETPVTEKDIQKAMLPKIYKQMNG